MKPEWHQRIDRRLKELGWTKAELSRRSGISYDRINKYLRGDVDQPRGEVLEKLSETVGIPLKALLFGSEEEIQLPTRLHSQIEVYHIPLVSLSDLSKAAFGQSFSKFLQGVSATIAVDAQVNQNSFGVVIEDSSMAPEMQVDDIIICDPIAEIQPGDLVFSKIDNPKQVVFRKLRPKHADPKIGPAELIPANSDFPMLTIPPRKKGFIVGRGVRHIRNI